VLTPTGDELDASPPATFNPMKHPIRTSALAILALPLLPLRAGETTPKPEKPGKKTAVENNGDWCEWLQDRPGELYRSKKNPLVQSFRIGGRFHYQAAYLDGSDVNGRDFHDTYDEYRRFRLETKTGFLEFFTLEANVNLVDDKRF